MENLAERADIHSTYISSIENGHRNPTLNVLGDLARALNTTISELTDGI
jgi:transcriptional regulator with XRE-family HTH domain